MPESSRPRTPGSRRRSQRLAHPEERESLIDRQLAEAINSPGWRNLKGKGRKLNLDPPPGVPPDMVMAHKIMEDANVQPSWLEDRTALLAKIEARREQWRRRFRQLDPTRPNVSRLRKNWTEQVRREVAGLNREIRNLNLVLPLWRLEVVPLQPEDEIAAAADNRAVRLTRAGA